MIQGRSALGMQRQIFFTSAGGYDTHTNQVNTDPTTGPHANLLNEISECVYAFQRAMEQLTLGNKVTSFTASDFGRTFPTNGQGSDHGWGSHHLVVGGAVRGQQTYGKFPTLAINGPDDTSTGRWIPTTSVDQYSATLARWFGVSNNDLGVIFPNLGRFCLERHRVHDPENAASARCRRSSVHAQTTRSRAAFHRRRRGDLVHHHLCGLLVDQKASHRRPGDATTCAANVVLPARRIPPATVADAPAATRPAPSRHQRKRSRSSLEYRSRPPIMPASVTPESAASPDVRTDLEEVLTAIRDFRNSLGGNPVGTNAEITKALLGDNLKQVEIPLPAGSRINGNGETATAGALPYFFHQPLSRDKMEIRSAGPDRQMWTADDRQMVENPMRNTCRAVKHRSGNASSHRTRRRP